MSEDGRVNRDDSVAALRLMRRVFLISMRVNDDDTEMQALLPEARAAATEAGFEPVFLALTGMSDTLTEAMVYLFGDRDTATEHFMKIMSMVEGSLTNATGEDWGSFQ